MEKNETASPTGLTPSELTAAWEALGLVYAARAACADVKRRLFKRRAQTRWDWEGYETQLETVRDEIVDAIADSVPEADS